jgi:hypothetical protein
MGLTRRFALIGPKKKRKKVNPNGESSLSGGELTPLTIKPDGIMNYPALGFVFFFP